MNTRPRFIHARLVVDGDGRRFGPGTLVLDGPRVIDAGPTASIGPAPEGAAVEHHPDLVVTPALVNTHAHLDLTDVGPRPRTGDFLAWIDMVRAERAADAAAIRAAVTRGADLSVRGGTAFIGDIAGVGSSVPFEALRDSPLRGISFVEVFGIGAARDRGLAAVAAVAADGVADTGGVRVGLQPHAPYSCALDVFLAAAARGLPCSTHLAETPEETEFVRVGTGPFREFLERLGLWDDSIVPSGVHPVDALMPALEATPFVAAHVNDLDTTHVARLAATRTSVAYCPRASTYFGHPRDGESPHRYRELLAAGVNVALGTDSIINLDTADRISVLDEVRLLRQRDDLDPILALRMATVHGARALGLSETLVTFSPGPIGGVLGLAVGENCDADPLVEALAGDASPRWLAGPFPEASSNGGG